MMSENKNARRVIAAHFFLVLVFGVVGHVKHGSVLQKLFRVFGKRDLTALGAKIVRGFFVIPLPFRGAFFHHHSAHGVFVLHFSPFEFGYFETRDWTLEIGCWMLETPHPHLVIDY
jgi:hypothetical protein